MKSHHKIALLMIAVLSAATAFGQNQESTKFYKLDFTVKEVEGSKTLNSHNYSMIVATTVLADKSGPPGSIRTGSRVPTQSSPESKQFNFVELGTNIDCRAVQEIGGELTMVLTAEISTMLQDTSPPVMRQLKWSSSVVVPIKKPSIVFASDDATTKRQMQLELTATPVR